MVWLYNTAIVLQVHPHSCSFRRTVHRWPLRHGWFPGCHWLRNRNLAGRHHYLPVLWDLCKGTKWSWQYGCSALLNKKTSHPQAPWTDTFLLAIQFFLYNYCFIIWTQSVLCHSKAFVQKSPHMIHHGNVLVPVFSCGISVFLHLVSQYTTSCIFNPFTNG